MTTAELQAIARVCARPGCGKPVPVRTTGRAGRYCSPTCRLSAFRKARRAEEARVDQLGTPRNETPPAGSDRRGAYAGPRCPTDPTHGPLIAWPDSERWGWYCPHQAHDGWGDTPRTRAFFTTAEVDRGSIDAAPRSAPVIPTVLPPSGATEETAESDQALTRAPSAGEVVARHVNDVIAAGSPTARPDTHSRPGAEPSGVTRSSSADAPRATSSDGGSPETERAIANVATPGRSHSSAGSGFARSGGGLLSSAPLRGAPDPTPMTLGLAER